MAPATAEKYVNRCLAESPRANQTMITVTVIERGLPGRAHTHVGPPAKPLMPF